MDNYDISSEYFEWLYSLVGTNWRFTRTNDSFRRLFKQLHEIDFTYTLPMDSNREADGIDLRYRFGYDTDYSFAMIAAEIDIHPCSVLEMLIALAVRCEEQIMSDPDYGDRTSDWFWGMLDSLNISSFSDRVFDREREEYIQEAVDIFMDRRYEADGTGGGLFIVTNPPEDLRNVDIWYQMNWCLTKNMERLEKHE